MAIPWWTAGDDPQGMIAVAAPVCAAPNLLRVAASDSDGDGRMLVFRQSCCDENMHKKFWAGE
jgi:hypothetical protein